MCLQTLSYFPLLIFPHSDDYNGVPPLDPEKLKIFNTVREITGLSVCLCVLVNMY